jgi:hypothetical protein
MKSPFCLSICLFIYVFPVKNHGYISMFNGIRKWYHTTEGDLDVMPFNSLASTIPILR